MEERQVSIRSVADPAQFVTICESQTAHNLARSTHESPFPESALFRSTLCLLPGRSQASANPSAGVRFGSGKLGVSFVTGGA
jgi:hypothetical protein